MSAVRAAFEAYHANDDLPGEPHLYLVVDNTNVEPVPELDPMQYSTFTGTWIGA